MDRRKFSKSLLTVGAISITGMSAFGSTTRSKHTSKHRWIGDGSINFYQ